MVRAQGLAALSLRRHGAHSLMLTGVLKSAFRLWSNSSPRVRLAGRGEKVWSETTKKALGYQGFLNNNWRRGRDSNSGRTRILDGFQDRCIKPLCHLSSICIIFFILRRCEAYVKLKKQRGKYKNAFAILFIKCQALF